MNAPFKLKLVPRSTLKGKVSARFPASINALSPLVVNQSGFTWTFSVDIPALESAIGLFTDTEDGLTPASGGGTTTFLRADGQWIVPPGAGGGAAGGNTQIQYNDGAGTFGGDPDFTWDKNTNTLAFNAASGTSINWGGGDVVLTHTLNTLTVTGASDVDFGVGGNIVAGTIQLGNTSDTTLERSAPGAVDIEGQTILTEATGQPLDSDLTAIAALAGTGLVARTGTGTAATRTITFGGSAGLVITDGDGVAANPTINLTNDLNALEGLTGTDTIYYRSGTDTWTAVTIGSNLTFSGGTLAASTGTATVGDGDYGDIVVSGSGTVWTIDVDVVTNAKLANMAQATVKGRADGAGTGDPTDLTAAQLVTIITTADGAGSGLDADLLDGNSSAFFATATDLANHLADTTDAHDASAISYVAGGSIAATNVQTAIEELRDEKQPLDADLTSWALITRAAGFDTWVASPTSANLASLVTGETGTGALVFANTPTLIAPVLGTPTSGNLANCNGLLSIVAANEATDATCFVSFFTAATGDLGPKTNANLTFNSSTGVLSVGGSPVVTSAVGAPDQVTVANEAADTSCFLGFFTDATGDLAPKTNANMTFNSLTGVVTFASSVLTTADINGGTIDGAVIGGATPAAGTFTAAVANSFVPNSASVPTNGMYLPAANTLGWAINGGAELQLTGTALSPAADGGNSLGTTSLGWQQLHLNTAAVINVDNGNWVATHTSGVLTVGTGDLRVTTAGTNAASVVTIGGTQTLTGKSIDAATNTITNIETTNIEAATLVTAADTIAGNDNDTTWPTTAAVIDYAQPLDATLDALAAFDSDGIIVQTASDTFASRSIVGPAAGITVTNGDGVAGDPTLALANDLAALEALAGTDTIYYRSGVDTWTAVTIGANLTFTGGTLAASSGTATVGDGDYGDIVVSGTGTVWTIDTNVVTYAKMQQVSAASKLLGRGDSGAGNVEEITLGAGLTMTGTTLSSSGGGGAPTSAQYLTLALDGTLSAERVLVGGAGLTLTDGGANGNATLAVGAGTGITVNADDVAVNNAVVPFKTDNLSVFAATTSAQLAGVISDETGSGPLVFRISPQLTTPEINDTSADHQYVFAVNELTADRTITLPLLTANDVFVFQAFAQTLTNKTIALGSNTISGTTAQFNTALSDNDFATLAGAETLTNKTIALGSNTVSGTTAQFNTALTDGDFATLAGTETLSNKTLTLPQINDTSSDHQYVFAVNELAADRTVTLPLLTAGDTFVFEAHTQTLSNKSLTSPTVTGTPTAAGATWTNLGTVTTADINGGTLDGTVIGGAAAAAATVTTLTSQTHLPAADGTYDLGSTTLAWNNLHLDTGATINVENGNWVATHTSGILTVSTGDLRVTTAGTNAASVVTVGGTQTLTGKTIDLTSNTLVGSVAEFNAALESADFYTTGGTDVALADGGTGASLTAPTVDRLLMWDQGGSTIAFGVLGNIATHGSPTTGDFLLVQRQSSDDLVKVDWADLPGAAGGAPTSAQYLVVTLDGTLSAERSIAAGNGINFTDGGANSTFTIAADAASDTVDGIVELATTTEVLTGTDATRAVTPDSLAALWEKGANVASAATLSLGEGGYFHVTGTTTITDIDFATPKDGRDAILEFDGVLTLTHNATTLKLPGGASITTAAGDTCRVVQDATDNVRVAWYQRAAGGAIGAQPLDATLTALAAFNTNGLLTQTAADTFAGRTITGTANQITVTAGDGVSGNPTLSLPSDIIVPTVITTPNTGLHLLDTNASHDLIVAPGSDLTADRTLTVVTGDRNHAIDFTDPGAADTFWGWDDSADRWEALTAAEAAAIISGTSTFQPLDTTLTAFAAYNTNGLITQTAADTFTGRTITGTTNEIEVTNGNGVAGNPTIGLPDTIVITTSIELGNATDTTLARVSAGQVSIEGVTIATSSNTLTLTNKTFDANGTGNALSNVEVADFAAAAITTAADTIAGNDSDTQVPTTAAVIDFVTGRKEIYVPAAAMWPKATNGAAEITYDSGANDVTVFALGFDTTTQEYAQFGIAMPNSWDEGTVTFIPYWTNTGGASTQTVVWSLAGRALSNDDAIDGTFGTVQTSTDTWLAQNDMHVGPESAAITIGGTPAANDFVMFEISRVVGSDNMAGDAVLLGIKLVLTMATANDA